MANKPGYTRPQQDSRSPFGDPSGYQHPRREYGSDSEHGDLYGSTVRLAGPHHDQNGGS
jgi:hypothetical protein